MAPRRTWVSTGRYTQYSGSSGEELLPNRFQLSINPRQVTRLFQKIKAGAKKKKAIAPKEMAVVPCCPMKALWLLPVSPKKRATL